MKRIYSYVFAAVAMFAAVSCQKENTIDAPEANEEAFAITAVANADTKTALVDGVKTYWTSTDALTVFDATASNRKFTTDITENSASAKFTTSTFVLPENLETAMLLAVYPYTEGATTDFSTAITGLELPATQQAVAGGFDSDATIAFALGGLADQHNLKFNNVYGLFEFVVNEDNVKEVTIRANGGEKIAGPVSLALNGTLVAAEGAVSEVTLEGDFVKGSTYYVALIPGTYASGITVSFDGEEVKSTSNEVVLEKNQIRGMGELSIPAVRLYVQSEYTHFDMNIYAWGIEGVSLPSTWPGVAMKWDEKKSMYYYDFPYGITGKKLSYIVNNGVYQTADLDATISTSEYVDDKNVNWHWLYLKPSNNWKDGNPWYAACFNPGNEEYWMKAIGPDENGVYGFVQPPTKDKVEFARMNPGAKDMNWGNKWNSTATQTIPTDGNNYFQCTEGWWDAHNDPWTKYTLPN